MLPDRVPHVLSRNANMEGEGALTIRDLLKASLRMRPNWLIVGEVRSVEAVDMLQALNTGHPGASTIHANSAKDALSRLETMILFSLSKPASIHSHLFLIYLSAPLIFPSISPSSKNRYIQFKEQFKEAMRSISGALKVGYSLENAIGEAQKELQPFGMRQHKISGKQSLRYVRQQFHIIPLQNQENPCKENKSSEYVSKSLSLRTSYKNYAVTVTWESDSPLIFRKIPQ